MKRCWIVLCAMLCLAGSGPAMAKQKGQQRIDSIEAMLPGLPEDTNKVNLLNDLSYAYSSVDAEKGLQYGKQSIALAISLGWKKGEAWAMNSIANNYLLKSDYPKALDQYFKALKLNEERADTAAICIVSGNISSIYYVQGDYAKTIEFCMKPLALAEKIGDKMIQLNILGNIGISYISQKDYTKAIEYLSKAVKIAADLNSNEDITKNLGNLANAYSKDRQYAKAMEYNFRALHLAKADGIKASVAIDLGNIGETYFTIAKDSGTITPGKYVPASKAANLDSAISFLSQGVAGCKEIGFLAPMAEFSSELSEAYKMKGDYKAALQNYTEYITYKDSVFSAENTIKITNLETQRAIDLKNKQIEIDKLAVAKKRNERGFFIVGMGLLVLVIIIVFRNYKVQMGLNRKLSVAKRKVELRTEELDQSNHELNLTLINLKETQEQLIAAEKIKENELIRSRISQDIHDDISSELTRISWVSELAKAKMKKDEFTDMPGLLEKITSSSRETVTKLGEIIWTVNPQNDSLESLLKYMREHISKFFADTDFAYSINFPETGIAVPINPELKRNLFLVMKEALHNTVKYSGARNVNVSLSLHGNQYNFCITDDGKGIEEGVINGSGNGLGNMRKRMENVQGSCKITSGKDKGTQVCCEGILY